MLYDISVATMEASQAEADDSVGQIPDVTVSALNTLRNSLPPPLSHLLHHKRGGWG